MTGAACGGATMREIVFSPAGKVLVLEPRMHGRDVPFVCVEMASKWATLIVLYPGGEVIAEDFGALEPHAAKNAPAFVDHCPNPDAVEAWASAMGYYVDDCSMDMIVGRWFVEVIGR